MAPTGTGANGNHDTKPDEAAWCARRIALAMRRHRYLSQKLLQPCSTEERGELEREIALEARLVEELTTAREQRRCGCE